MRFNSDVDIDLADRSLILEKIDHTAAAMRNVSPIRKHATGVHVTQIPYDAINDMANIDYTEADNRGYFKLDLLNVHVYEHVRDEKHLIEMMNKEPNWQLLNDPRYVEKLIHINNYYSTIKKLPEPINSIPRLAMFLAIIRPAKKHLMGLPWKEVAKTVWDKTDAGYSFKQAHGVAYAHLVAVHMNLLEENGNKIG